MSDTEPQGYAAEREERFIEKGASALIGEDGVEAADDQTPGADLSDLDLSDGEDALDEDDEAGQ